ncbi:MAG: type II toxin-antitoxin system MqsA family antitoxin [Rhizobacter sp.]|nr:type II toxin-antitoxin system MqsA family antitoxin [Chlorobiales bacterium]
MRCVICKTGETAAGVVTVMLEREGRIAVFRNVPAEVCQNCGEYYLSSEVTSRLLAAAEDAGRRGAEVEVVMFAA